jgi:hypothetical protein
VAASPTSFTTIVPAQVVPAAATNDQILMVNGVVTMAVGDVARIGVAKTSTAPTNSVTYAPSLITRLA